VDLSQRSLDRARFRTALLGRHLEFLKGDINQRLTIGRPSYAPFHHIEAYGVLHHIPSFATTLRLMADNLAPEGVVRIMVYNGEARNWIYEINHALANLGLRFENDHDIETARNVLTQLAGLSPRLAERLRQMGPSSLKNNSRFADTFMHPWESRATIKQWFDAIKKSGLKPVALHDRYAELDDLPNPLWKCPTADELTERAMDMRFENNLELWLVKKDSGKNGKKTHESKRHASRIPVRLRLTMPPSRLSLFDETAELPLGTKLALWHGFLRTLYNRVDSTYIKLLKTMDRKQTGRLARMGLILPESARDAGIYDQILKPMTSSMTPPTLPHGSDARVQASIETICSRVQSNHARSGQAARRFKRVVCQDII
jgi:SAM-dependent methyltransferase